MNLGVDEPQYDLINHYFIFNNQKPWLRTFPPFFPQHLRGNIKRDNKLITLTYYSMIRGITLYPGGIHLIINDRIYTADRVGSITVEDSMGA